MTRAGLITRVLRAQDPRVTRDHVGNRLEELRHITGSVKVDERPIINKHYGLTFREIDNFDTLLGLLAWRPRLLS